MASSCNEAYRTKSDVLETLRIRKVVGLGGGKRGRGASCCAYMYSTLYTNANLIVGGPLAIEGTQPKSDHQDSHAQKAYRAAILEGWPGHSWQQFGKEVCTHYNCPVMPFQYEQSWRKEDHGGNDG